MKPRHLRGGPHTGRTSRAHSKDQPCLEVVSQGLFEHHDKERIRTLEMGVRAGYSLYRPSGSSRGGGPTRSRTGKEFLHSPHPRKKDWYEKPLALEKDVVSQHEETLLIVNTVLACFL